MNGLNSVVRLDLAGLVAHNHDRDLLDERRPALGIQRPVAEELERSRDVLSLSGLEGSVTAAVVSQRAGLEHERQSELLSERLDVLGVARVEGRKGSSRDAVVPQVLVLEVLVLNQANSSRRRLHLAQSLLLDRGQDIGIHMLNLDSEHVALLGQLADVLLGRECAVDVRLARRGEERLLRRRVSALVEDDEIDAEQRSRVRQHTAELATA